MERKDFLSKAFRLAVGKSLEILTENPLEEKLEALADSVDTPPSRPFHRPPGAHSNELRFKELCTGCDRCMMACPVNVIMIDDLEQRTPAIFPEEGPCIHCSGYPCIQSCETGALSFDNDPIPNAVQKLD